MFQLDKLRVEREERARAGAPTPPTDPIPVEHFENRNVLKPVERPEDSDEPEKNPDATSADGDKSVENGGDSAKEPQKPADGEKTEYAEMTNQRSSGNFGPPAGVPVAVQHPGYLPPGGAMMPGPQANGFAPPSRPPPPPYMNGAAQAPPIQAQGQLLS